VAHVLIYVRGLCWYCRRATLLLQDKGVSYEEVELLDEPHRYAEMIERSGGGFTVPQILIDGRPIGGSDELVELEATGRLDALLSATPADREEA
jgi:glutaredoxin 3